MVVVANRGPVESPFPSTHFSATKSQVVNQRVPGAKLTKLTPKVYDSYDLATKVAKKRMQDRLQRTVFDRLRQINFEIDTLDENISELQEKLKKAKTTHTNLERDLLELGFNITELRTLRKTKDKGSSEKYVPESVTDMQEATPTPVYVPSIDDSSVTRNDVYTSSRNNAFAGCSSTDTFNFNFDPNGYRRYSFS